MNKKSSSAPFIVVMIIIVLLFGGCISSCSGTPGKGNTSICTICGKHATHHTTKYGFCDEHWRDATGGLGG